MNSLFITTHPSSFHAFPHPSTTKTFNLLLKKHHFLLINNSKFRTPHFFTCCSSPSSSNSESEVAITQNNESFHAEVGSPKVPTFASPMAKFSSTDQAFFLLSFIACTTSVAFTGLVFAAVPTLFAVRNAAISLSKLADTAREELPSTMAAVRLSGMEISDLTLELSDLSQDIADGVNKSAQALQAAETGIRQISSMAQQHTISMIQERARLPIISLQPVVAGAAKKTSRAVGQATKSIMNIISGKEDTGEYHDEE